MNLSIIIGRGAAERIVKCGSGGFMYYDDI